MVVEQLGSKFQCKQNVAIVCAQPYPVQESVAGRPKGQGSSPEGKVPTETSHQDHEIFIAGLESHYQASVWCCGQAGILAYPKTVPICKDLSGIVSDHRSAILLEGKADKIPNAATWYLVARAMLKEMAVARMPSDANW